MLRWIHKIQKDSIKFMVDLKKKEKKKARLEGNGAKTQNNEGKGTP